MNPTKTKLLQIIGLLYITIPTILVISSNTRFAPVSIYTLGQVFAVLGLSLICLQPFLSSRIKPIESGVGHDRLMRWHATIGKSAFTLLILHPIFILAPSLSVISVGRLIASLNFYHRLGSVALFLLIFTVILAIYSEKLKLKYETWRTLHKLVYVVIILGFIHSYFLGSNINSSDPVFYWWLFAGFVATTGIVNRYIVRKYTTYKIFKIKHETSNVISIYVKPLAGKVLKHYPGQFAFTIFESKSLPREEHHFTISSAPNGKYIRFSIKASGDYTSAIGKLKVGDKVQIDGPYGSFTNSNLEEPVVFIAGGIGITPVMAMLESINTQETKPKCALIYANKTKNEIAFYDQIIHFTQLKWLKSIFVLSEEKLKGFKNGRIDQALLSQTLKGIKTKATIFLVGPPPMMESIENQLKEIGIHKSQIHTEKFSLK